MSISDEHKKIYTDAINALSQDIKIISSRLIDRTGNVLAVGYDATIDLIGSIPAAWITPFKTRFWKSQETIPINGGSENADGEDIFDLSDEIDATLLTVSTPDILVILRKKYISRVYVFDECGSKKLVKGKIIEYPYINEAIHEWFKLSASEGNIKWRWYAKDKLDITEETEVLFRYSPTGYYPFRKYSF